MAFFNLGKMTFGSLFKKPETLKYPFEKQEEIPKLKGHVVNHVESCILCGICSKKCPCHTISVDKDARTWTIFEYRCIQCGFCVRECPKNCLEMAPNYAPVTRSPQKDMYTIPEQAKKEKNEEKVKE